MTIEEILQELSPFNGRFPEAAFQAAIEQREAITPHLLQALEEVAADPATAAKRTDWMLPIFATYLLAQFRERRAFLPLVQICSAPRRIASNILGDSITEGICRVIASVYDGNPAPLKAWIENPRADDFARAAALDALLVLEATGQMPRQEVVDYFRELLHGRMPRDGSYACDGLASAIAKLPAPELLDEVRAAFENGLFDACETDLKYILPDLQMPPGSIQDTASGTKTLIDDARAEIACWACFQDNQWPGPPIEIVNEAEPDADTDSRPADLPPTVIEPPKPIRVGPKTGRNDPCPCGSGKKFKHCCLGKAR